MAIMAQGIAYGRLCVVSVVKIAVVKFRVNVVMFSYVEENVSPVDILLFIANCKTYIDE